MKWLVRLAKDRRAIGEVVAGSQLEALGAACALAANLDFTPQKLDVLPLHEIIVTCGCKRAYTKKEWKKLARCGIQRYPWGEVHELRHCTCKSTIAAVMHLGEPQT